MSDNKRSKALKEKEAQIKKLTKTLDKDGRASINSMLSVIRSSVRKAWMRHPTKLSLLHKHKVYVDDVADKDKPEGITANAKWLYQCEECLKYFLARDIEVDHKSGEHSMDSLDDMKAFTQSLLDVSWNDLQILDKECHLTKTYAERYNMSFEEAKKEKGVIEVMKKKAPQQRAWLKDRGVTPANNADGRREQIREIISKKL